MKIVDRSPVASVVAFMDLTVGSIFCYNAHFFMAISAMHGTDGHVQNAVHLSPETRGTPCIFSPHTEVTRYSATLEVTRG